MIVGILSWWNERPEWLANVAGFARVCDAIVAVDGSYGLVPGANAMPCSPLEQAETVQAYTEAAGASCLVYRPTRPFAGNEVEKRNLSLRLAATLNPDWLLVFDADMRVVYCDPGLIRAELAVTGRNVGTYQLRDGRDGQSWETPFRGIYRWADDLAYGPAHSDVVGTYDGMTESLRDDAPAFEVALTVVHPVGVRHPERAAAATTFDAARVAYGIEALA